MQIGRHRATSAMRQPSSMGSMGMQGQRLVFLYPMLCDNQYFKHLNMLRDFFTVNYVGEIKVSNALNVISDSHMNVGSIGTGSNTINPAQFVRQSVWGGSANSADNPQFDQWASIENRQLYQDRILQFNTFLQNQIQHDFRYTKFRPFMSSISVENLMMIPLIVGTQSYTISSEFLYMLLGLALAYDIPLSSDSNVSRLFHIMDITEHSKLVDLIKNEESRNKLNRLIGYKPAIIVNGEQTSPENVPMQSVRKWIGSEKSMAKAFFDVVLNLRNWQVVTGNVESRESVTINTITIPTATQKRHYERSLSSFGAYVENIIVPILHNIEVMVGPTPGNVSIGQRTGTFVEAIIGEHDSDARVVEHYENVSTAINASLQGVFDNKGINQMQTEISRIVDLCKENADIGQTVKAGLNEFDKNLHLPMNFNGADLNKFVKTITMLSTKLNTRRSVLLSWVERLTNLSTDSSVSLKNATNKIYVHFEQQLNKLFYLPDPDAGLYSGAWIDKSINDKFEFAKRYQNYTSLMFVQLSPPVSEYQWRQRIEQNATSKGMGGFYQAIEQIRIAMLNILKFLFEWNFFSYTCSYMNDIEADIEVQKRDALEFPNYCLVLPFELFKGLYIIQTAQNYKNYLNSKKPPPRKPILKRLQISGSRISLEPNEERQKIQFSQRDMMINTGDVLRMITLVNDRLKVPNLILIDEKTNTCYYKFMYMNKPIRTTMSGLQQFVQHQKTVLPGF